MVCAFSTPYSCTHVHLYIYTFYVRQSNIEIGIYFENNFTPVTHTPFACLYATPISVPREYAIVIDNNANNKSNNNFFDATWTPVT